MDRKQGIPWSFTIEFDEDKAENNGYRLDDLYDCVGRIVEPLGNVRTGRGSWRAEDASVNHSAQPVALCCLCEQDWVMRTVRSWVTYEGDQKGEDYLRILRRHRPYLVCVE